jgi:hypothetical protein
VTVKFCGVVVVASDVGVRKKYEGTVAPALRFPIGAAAGWLELRPRTPLNPDSSTHTLLRAEDDVIV